MTIRRLTYSAGSPFARKVRIVLAELELDFEANEIGTFPPPDDAVRGNPNLTVPVLRDGDLDLFDSNLIIEYLLATYGDRIGTDPSPPLRRALTRPDHHWRDAKVLTTIETMANSLVSHAYMQWTGLQPVGPNAVGFDWQARQMQRARSCLDWLEDQVTEDGFVPGAFSIQDIALICPLMWNAARLDLPLGGRPGIDGLLRRHADRPSVRDTAVPPWSPA